MSTNPTYKISISGTRRDLERTRELVHFISCQHGLKDTEADLVEMAVSEACNNVLRHGGNKKQARHFNLELLVDKEAIHVVITDSGKPFDFDSIEPFNISQDFMSYQNGGLGIPLMKALMDEVLYARSPDNTNQITLIKYLRRELKKGGE